MLPLALTSGWCLGHTHSRLVRMASMAVCSYAGRRQLPSGSLGCTIARSSARAVPCDVDGTPRTLHMMIATIYLWRLAFLVVARCLGRPSTHAPDSCVRFALTSEWRAVGSGDWPAWRAWPSAVVPPEDNRRMAPLGAELRCSSARAGPFVVEGAWPLRIVAASVYLCCLGAVCGSASGVPCDLRAGLSQGSTHPSRCGGQWHSGGVQEAPPPSSAGM